MNNGNTGDDLPGLKERGIRSQWREHLGTVLFAAGIACRVLRKLVTCSLLTGAGERYRRGHRAGNMATRMHFGRRRTPLQRAFLESGIDLREYRQAFPSNPRERSRHDALVNCAYKRVASLRLV